MVPKPSAKQAVLIVHGSWHTPGHYEPLISALEASSYGFTVQCPLLPTCSGGLQYTNGQRNPPTAPLKMLADDSELIRTTATTLVEQGHAVTVIMHSYGGVVGSNALTGLGWAQRAGEGKPGGIVRLLYMCAFLLPKGMSLAGAFGGELPPFMTAYDDGTIEMHDPADRFYNDIAEPDRQRMVRELVMTSTSPQFAPADNAAWLEIPVTYLLCEKDAAIPLEAQRGMIEGAKKEGVEVDVQSCSASHSPFASMPGEVVACVERCWVRDAKALPQSRSRALFDYAAAKCIVQ